MNNFFIQTFLIVLMFLLSGLDKTNAIPEVANGLKKRVNLDVPDIIYTMAIILIIALQVVASLILLYSAYTGEHKELAYYSALSLAGFTVLATLIYHFPPYGKEYYKFLSNVAVLGGLLLLADNLRK
jgi:uncharacterized membrane protein YphA (DoxX/SURF4 family)